MSIFNEVQMSGVPSNSFDLSHDVKLSMNMGQLVPVNVIECIPGDAIDISTTVMARMAPMVAPPMQKYDIDIHHFFVPNRLLWDNWEKFITTGTPTETSPAAPYITYNGTVAAGSLADYLGLPVGKNMTQPINALPFAAYQKIYWDYFRDQNLQDPTITDLPKLADGANTLVNVSGVNFGDMRKRAWAHDYFCSALPFAQKGDEVELGMGQTAELQLKPYPHLPQLVTTTGGAAVGASDLVINASGEMTNGAVQVELGTLGRAYNVDLATATAVTINQLRWAIKLQEYLERNARGGTRYIEHILAHFGVHSSDKRLQRSEFLGSSRQHMVISEVLSAATTETTAGGVVPQGNMAGHGISVGQGNTFKYFAEEHGFLMSICSIRPKASYYQGLHRLWNRFDPLSYAYPTFANLGEQEILNQEIYYDEADSLNDDVFGYIPRYSEYKYQPSRVAGEMRTSLEFWHHGRKFATRPALNSQFITCDPDTRIFAVDDSGVTHHIYAQFLNNLHVRRRLPKFGIPTI